MPTDVFISYSRKDAEFALKLTADLQSRTIRVWIDQGDIVAGDAWRKQIVDGIAGCRVFLVVLSPNSVKSENVIKELSLADSSRKKIIPIVYQPVDIPKEMEYQLAGLQYQAFNQGTYEDNLVRLVGVIAGQPVAKIAPQIAEPAPSVPAQRPASGGRSNYIGIALGVGCVIVLLAIVGAVGIFIIRTPPTPTHAAVSPLIPSAVATATVPTQTPPPTTLVPTTLPPTTVAPARGSVTVPPPPPTTPPPTTITLPPPTTPTRVGPPTCTTSVGSAFASLWNDPSVYSRLGCARNSAHTNQSAEEGFVNGFMLWREDTQQVYAITNDGTWQGFTNSFDESHDPEYSCGTHSSPPSPRRGFSKIWCGNSDIHSKLGNATEAEAGFCMTGSGACETFQDFSGGTMFYSQRSNRVYALMSDGTWKSR